MPRRRWLPQGTLLSCLLYTSIFSPLIVARVSESYGWGTLFFGFCAVTIVAAALLFVSAVLVEQRRATSPSA